MRGKHRAHAHQLISMPSRRDIAIGTIVLLVAFAAALLWLRRPSTPPAPAPREVAQAPVAEETDAPAAPTREPRRELKPRREPSNVERAERLRRRAKFPPDSRAIDDGLDPIAGKRVGEIGRSGEPDEPGQHLVVQTTDSSYQAPGEVLIRARVVELDRSGREYDGDIPELSQEIRALSGEILDDEGEAVVALTFADDGQNGDGLADDRDYTATLTPDPDRPEEFQGRYTIEVSAETMTGEILVATTSFFYSTPGAHLTGQYRDAIVDGHLQIEAEVEVETAGEFRIEATLSSDAAIMLGHARTTVTLEPGTSWVPMRFWGLILREQQVDGPYMLFSVTLSELQGDVTLPSDVVGSPYSTAAHKAADFTDRTYDDPELLEAAKRLESAGG